MTDTTSAVKPTWLKRIVILCLKLLLILATVMAGYGIYLDGKIDQKFSYDHWKIPAKVYAQSLSLQPKQHIARNQVIDELALLNYRRVSNPSLIGEYSVSATKIDIYRRGFEYIDGSYPPSRVMLQFDGNFLKSIVEYGAKGQSLDKFNLEPKLLKRLTGTNKEDRLFVPREQIPELLVATLIHVEDRNFYQHRGIAPLSILRALIANVKAGRTVQGGSTLTQQLVKNVFLTREKSLWRKVKEAYYSILIEIKYSKDQLLEIYFNEVFLGQNGTLSVNGFGLASQFYFSRPLNELTADQVALMVAMIKGPSYYSPTRHPKRALQRRDLILRQMLSQALISSSQYKAAAKRPIIIKRGIGSEGQYHGFMSLVRSELRSRFTRDFSASTGISIFTTIDSSAQRFAQQSLTERVKALEKSTKTNNLEGSVIVANYRSGEIKALVEGKNANYAGFNRAINAKRPIGSLIKPFILATALENGAKYTLGTQLADKPFSLTDDDGKVWTPLNYDKEFRGQANILDSLTYSYNIPMVNLGLDIGLENISDTLTRAGWNNEFQLLPSMLLGAIETSPWQVTQLYQSLANDGETKTLHTVVAVTDNDDQTFFGYHHLPVQAISTNAAYLTKYAMTHVTKKGTAKALRWQNQGKLLAGKTGTTDDLRDSWYAGFDNNETTVVWLGRDDNKSTGLTGSSGALNVYSDFVNSRGGVSLSLARPEGISTGYVDKISGVAVAQDCNETIAIPVLALMWPKNLDCGGDILVPEPLPKKKKKSVFDDFFSIFK